jgi:hypothetical protein
MRGKAISHLPRHPSSRAAPVILAVLLVAGCASSGSPGASSPPNSTSPIATSGPSAQGAPTLFTSTLYGYSVTLPAGWRVVRAQTAWDGTGSPTYDAPVVDQLIAPESTGRCTRVFTCGPLAWVLAAPTTKGLTEFAKEQDAAAAEHSCPASPEKAEQVTIDSQAGLLETNHCPATAGALTLSAVTIRGGIGYLINLVDLSSDPTAEPADRSDFLALLGTVHFSR